MGRGGKDIIPIYRDAGATNPNVTSGLPEFLSKKLEIELPSIEDIAAYTFALLSGPRFQERFAVELETAGVRLPLTADASIWRATVEFGREMIWLQSYAERSRDGAAGRGDRVPKVNGLGWSKSVVSLPNDLKDVDYNAETSELKIGDGTVSGVSSEVWNFEVSGMQIVRKWLGYRTAKGTGKAASSKNELDRIRPTRWHDDWNDELLDLLRVLTITVERQLDQASLVDRVCEGELIPANELPKPEPGQREVPKTLSSEAPSLF
jgi:hypothetical protein